MQFIVPTHYQASYLLPRKRNFDSVYLLSEVPVEIRDIGGDEAPIVHRIGEKQPDPNKLTGHGRSARYQMIEGEAVEVRMYDGELYVQLASLDEFQRQLASNDSERHDIFSASRYGDVQAGKFSYDVEDKVILSSFDDFAAAKNIEKIRKLETNLDEVIDSIQKYADELLIIDSFVFEKTVEPALLIYPSHDGKLVLGLSEAFDNNLCKVRHHLQANDTAYGVRFGLDEFDRAVEEGSRIASDNNLEFEIRVVIDQISPWEIDFRGDMETLYKKASLFVSATSRSVRFLDKHTATAWYDLSESIDLHHQPTSSMIDAMRRIASCDVKAFSHSTHQGLKFQEFHQFNEFQAVLEGIREGLRLWDSRSPGVLEWFDTSLMALPTYSDGERVWEVVDARTLRIIQKELGLDDSAVSEMITDALEGKASIVVVGPARGNNEKIGAVMSVACEDQPRITRFISTDRGMTHRNKYETLALQHVSAALDHIMDNEIGMSWSA